MTSQDPELNFFQLPAVGTALTVLSGLAFLLVCMLLPLVGRAGAATLHAGKNTVAFTGMTLLALGLGALATVSKLERRKIDGSPLPYFSLGLSGACILLLIALSLGALKI